MLIGAHVSVSGGVENAPFRAQNIGCTAMQIFTRNQRQWFAKPLTDAQIKGYQKNLSKSGIRSVIAHNSYLINLGTSQREVREKSLNAFFDEMQRAERLQISCLVFHPGAHKGDGEEKGLANVAENLNIILEKYPDFDIKLLLETTAGQGSGLGHTFMQLQQILEQVTIPHRVGVCLDTCHVFAAGYDLRSSETYEATMNQFDNVIGFDRLYAVHLNDSKNELGSRVDRHENIGNGHIGADAFRYIMNDYRLADVPKIVETPGGEQNYRENLNLLKSLVDL